MLKKNEFRDYYWTVGVFVCFTTISTLSISINYVFEFEIQLFWLFFDLLSSLSLLILSFKKFDLQNKPEHFSLFGVLAKSFQWPNKPDQFGLKFFSILSFVPWTWLILIYPENTISLLSTLRVLFLGRLLLNFFRSTTNHKGLKFLTTGCITLLAVHTLTCGWLIIEGFSDDNLTAYNKAFYWSMTTLTTIGYGDITPSNNISRMFTVVVMVIGVGVYGIIFGNISRVLLNADRHREAKKEKIDDISAFLRHYEIPKKLKREVCSYYDNIFSRHLSDKDNRIIGELPSALQEELKIYMKVKLIKELCVFEKLKISCLRKIAEALETKSYSPGQIIISEGEIGEEMFIIAHGEVQVESGGRVLANMLEGQFFGEIALVEDVTRRADVVSKSYCELYTLEKSNFINIVNEFPELELRFKKDYQSNLTLIRKAS
jgi:voltage-gated potassium channel